MFTRRDALKTLGALAGARYLVGCGDDESRVPPTMVFLMMENRTYDHLLGARTLLEGRPGDGLTAGMANLDASGNTIPIWSPPVDPMNLCVPDPPHDWDAAREQADDGACDGFVRAYQQAEPNAPPDMVMQYLTRQHQPVTWALADAYTTCDRWFASLLGPTLPNRMYWMAATANGAKDNASVLAGAFQGLPSIFTRLDDAGVDWAYYFGDVPVLGFVDGIDKSRIRRFMWQFINDAEAGRLPPVVFIDPSFTHNDDHPPHYPLLGQQLIAATYQALATSPQWKHSLLVITYDEHGGFFDHVAPGTAPDDHAAAGFDRLGFRVPSLVIGPHVRPGAVISTALEHTSALRHIENAFNLPPLTMRDAAANDLSTCLDLSLNTPTIAVPAVEVDESTLTNCSGKSFKPYDHDILAWADQRDLGKLDGRKDVLDQIYAIGEYLDKHNLGRIRRGR